MTMKFVDWEPHFSPEGESELDSEGLIWLYDAEGEPLLKCTPERASVIGAALEFTHDEIATVYGVGWGSLSDNEVACLLEDSKEILDGTR